MKHLKKLVSILLVGGMVFVLAACGRAADADGNNADQASSEAAAAQETITAENTDSTATEEREEDASASDTLVIYFSRTGEQYSVGVIDKGNTEIVADMIIEETGADSFQILPEEDYYPYTYDELTDIAKKEQTEKARPAYAGEVPDLSGYSTIYIGAPVWWGDWPMIMYTFFEENADSLGGRTLIPFSTHGGSGLSGFDKKLVSLFPDSTIGTGLAISGTDAQNKQDDVRNRVKEWIAGQ